MTNTGEGVKLTGPQLAMLRQYEDAGVTSRTFGRIDTWSALVRKGLLRRSYGPGAIESEITEAGRSAISSRTKGG